MKVSALAGSADRLLAEFGLGLREALQAIGIARQRARIRVAVAAVDGGSFEAVRLGATAHTAKPPVDKRLVRKAVLVPPADDILVKTIEIPRKAYPDIDQIVRLDIPVSTPFSLDEIYYQSTVRPSRKGGVLDLTIHMIPKTAVDARLAFLDAAYGARPRELELARDVLAPVNPADRVRNDEARRLDTLLLVLLLVLVAMLIALARSNADARIESLRSAMSASLASIDRQGQLRAMIRTLEDRRALSARLRLEVRPSVLLERAGKALPADARLVRATFGRTDASITLIRRGAPLGPAEISPVAEAVLASGFLVAQDVAAGTATLSGTLLDARPADTTGQGHE